MADWLRACRRGRSGVASWRTTCPEREVLREGMRVGLAVGGETKRRRRVDVLWTSELDWRAPGRGEVEAVDPDC